MKNKPAKSLPKDSKNANRKADAARSRDQGMTRNTLRPVREGPDNLRQLEKAGVAQALPPSRFEELVGIAGPGLSTDEIMAMTRGE
jgi:hypothetical protein